jgi:undecaprenyl phosphate-alpha-L-ara4N flippase subunit ArnE
MDKFCWTWKFFRDLALNWQLAASGLSMVMASLIWFYILKHNDLSLAYPLISISYIFGTFAAVFIFHETVTPTRWIGVLFIMIGVGFLTRQG